MYLLLKFNTWSRHIPKDDKTHLQMCQISQLSSPITWVQELSNSIELLNPLPRVLEHVLFVALRVQKTVLSGCASRVYCRSCPGVCWRQGATPPIFQTPPASCGDFNGSLVLSTRRLCLIWSLRIWRLYYGWFDFSSEPRSTIDCFHWERTVPQCELASWKFVQYGQVSINENVCSKLRLD